MQCFCRERTETGNYLARLRILLLRIRRKFAVGDCSGMRDLRESHPPSVLLMEPNVMKKLASLFAFAALGLFVVGCNEAGDDGPEPVPSDVGGIDTSGTPAPEGGSDLIDDGGPVDETPPVTDEAPPTLTPTPEEGTEAAPETSTESSALEEAASEESATAAAEAADTAEPATETEEAPQ